MSPFVEGTLWGLAIGLPAGCLVGMAMVIARAYKLSPGFQADIARSRRTGEQ